jgi:hypothetical protein
MAGVNFIFDPTNQMVKFSKQLKKAASRHRVATAFMLNEMAFRTRDAAIKDVFPRKFTLRNRAFARRGLQFRRTGTRVPSEQQESIFGSVRVGKSTGWIEQQFGRMAKRDHAGTLISRGRNRKRSMGRRFRMLSGRTFARPSDMDGSFKGDHHRAVAFIEKMKRDKFKDVFWISGHNKFPDGLYILRGAGKNRKPKLVQTLDPNNRIRRIRWSQLAVKAMEKRMPIDAMWAKAWKRLLKQAK